MFKHVALHRCRLHFALLLLAAQVGLAGAAGGVYQIGVLRGDGSRTAGSAVQLSPGVLLAACHTLRQADQIVVLHANRPFRAWLMRSDSHHDLCLLRTARFSGGIPERRASSDLRVGTEVSAYGFAAGFRMSIARGRITGLHAFDGARVIRISARFPRGASGGALFDADGRLIGVLVFRARDAELNFAMPMEWVERLLVAEGSAVMAPDAMAFWELGAEMQPAFLRAAQLASEGEWQALAELAAQWSDADPSDTQAWQALGRAQFAMGQSGAALTALERAVETASGSAEAWYALARTARAAGDARLLQRARERLQALDAELEATLDDDVHQPAR